jgi:hypothetical protein
VTVVWDGLASGADDQSVGTGSGVLEPHPVALPTNRAAAQVTRAIRIDMTEASREDLHFGAV